MTSDSKSYEYLKEALSLMLKDEEPKECDNFNAQKYFDTKRDFRCHLGLYMAENLQSQNKLQDMYYSFKYHERDTWYRVKLAERTMRIFKVKEIHRSKKAWAYYLANIHKKYKINDLSFKDNRISYIDKDILANMLICLGGAVGDREYKEIGYKLKQDKRLG